MTGGSCTQKMNARKAVGFRSKVRSSTDIFDSVSDGYTSANCLGCKGQVQFRKNNVEVNNLEVPVEEPSTGKEEKKSQTKKRILKPVLG